jgi:hypothetical protein
MKRIYAIVSALAVICITQVACTSSVQTAAQSRAVAPMGGLQGLYNGGQPSV